jgi:hypothetical protein
MCVLWPVHVLVTGEIEEKYIIRTILISSREDSSDDASDHYRTNICKTFDSTASTLINKVKQMSLFCVWLIQLVMGWFIRREPIHWGLSLISPKTSDNYISLYYIYKRSMY